MSDAPTGLYGWIQSNDGRSITLFLSFLVAVQAIVAMVLFLPLTVFDAEHAPFFGWSGYFLRYAPIVLAGSVLWFGWQMFWHIESVKRAVGFRFIDDQDEPRLCRVIEPLIMTMGLPIPFVAVIESDARNAFACGIARKKAVVVVTRGLIDDLGDEELACVLGHELSHIKNGDIRLMAAANIFMEALGKLHRNNPLKFTPIHVVLAVAVPAILPLTLAGGFIGHLALRAGQVSRLMIASAREFIADAEAVQVTQNPAAMASALVKVEHRWQVDGLRKGDDAMMIAGDTQGEGATHPTIAHRIAALARTTGTMVFNAPGAIPAGMWDQSPTLSEAKASALLRQLPKADILPRLRAGSSENVLGLTKMGLLYLATTVTALATLHWEELSSPRVMLAKFDIRPIAVMLGSPIACRFDQSKACEKRLSGNVYQDFAGQKNTLAGWMAETSRRRQEKGYIDGDLTVANFEQFGMKREPYVGQSGRLAGVTHIVDSQGMYQSPSGGYTSVKPDNLDVAEIDGVGCFPVTLHYGEPEGHYPLDKEMSDEMDVNTLVGFTERHVSGAVAPVSPTADKAMWDYVDKRRISQQIAYDFYGLPGLSLVRNALRGPEHAPVVTRLAERLKDPTFTRGKSGYDIASARAIVRSSDAFIPCPAVKHGALEG
jgi:Zn-dependent protease with chaperone function